MHAAAIQGAFLLKQYDRWLADLDDRHLALEPAPGAKTAGWLLGHLVITGDFARRLCGLPHLAPKEWRTLFAPGTTPSRDAGTYPPMRELIDTFRAVYADLAANAPSASAEALAAINPYESARAVFPTAGSFAAYILTGHLGYHLGQLSMWRAAAAPIDDRLRPLVDSSR
jgi:DinB family protein